MTENTKIEWATHTFNPWLGCTRVSPGCQRCYAEKQATRVNMVGWGAGASRKRTGAANWALPLRWNAKGKLTGIQQRVFSGSMCDVMDSHPSILPAWRSDFWGLIRESTYLEWLLLTKRPENWEHYLPVSREPFRHVRLGVTIEDQKRLDQRKDFIIRAALHGWPIFISYEPGLSLVDFGPILSSITWLIVGGESGPGSRPFHLDWASSAVEQARSAGVPVLVKQLGAKPFRANAPYPIEHPKGGDFDEFPEELRYRQFPQTISQVAA